MARSKQTARSKQATAAQQAAPALPANNAEATAAPKPVGYNRGTGIAKGADLSGYIRGLGRTQSGKPTLDIADEVAEALRGKTVDELLEYTERLLAKMDGEAPGLRAKYSHLNPGQIRMNCGNRLRAALKRANEAK